MNLAKALLFFSLAALPLAAADVPRKSPEYAAQTPAGGQILLSQYKGKVVCMAFMYTTCPHCQALARELTTLQAEYGPKGFQALGVAFDPGASGLLANFIKQTGATFPVGYSEREPPLSYLGLASDARFSIPQIVFIDKKGMIRQQSIPLNDEKTGSEANLRNMIQTLLAEPGGAAASAASKKKKKTTTAAVEKKRS